MLKNGVIIWGTGNTARRLLESGKGVVPEYFVDSDQSKTGSLFQGYQVRHPSDTDILWKEKIVVVASIYYAEITEQLTSMGLVEREDFISGDALLDVIDFESAIQKNLCFVTENISAYYEKSILFMCLTAYDAQEKGLGKFFEVWNQNREEGTLVLGSEATWLDTDTVNSFVALPVLPLPFFMGKGQYVKKDSYSLKNNQLVGVSASFLSDEKKVDIDRREGLRLAVENLRQKYPDMDEAYGSAIVYYIDIYIRNMFKTVKPTRIYLWNEFYAVHQIIRDVAREMDIEVKYFEFGNISGTLQLDEYGQMGESWPATHCEEFANLSVNELELGEAQKVWHYLYLSRENRKKQPSKDLWEAIKDQIIFGRPIILYAGQNDYESGIKPYTDRTKQYHSPIFKSSNEAALYLADICRRNQWNFIYKPHPIMCRNKHELSCEFPENVLLIKEADINEIVEISDVVVTILSTTAYTSLIRKKATVMLGYTQLKDKGCTYQAFEKDMIEEVLVQAVKEGFTEQMQKSFLKHLAQMNKYYLYNDMRDKCIQYGQL